VPSEQKINQPEYEVSDDYFLLRSRFAIFRAIRGFAVWYVLYNKTEKIVLKSVKHGLKIENKIVRQSLVFVSVAITALFFSHIDNVEEGNIY
jgi:hypothetical protein